MILARSVAGEAGAVGAPGKARGGVSSRPGHSARFHPLTFDVLLCPFRFLTVKPKTWKEKCALSISPVTKFQSATTKSLRCVIQTGELRMHSLTRSFHTVFVKHFLCLESSHLSLCSFGLVLISHGFFKVDFFFLFDICVFCPPSACSASRNQKRASYPWEL